MSSRPRPQSLAPSGRASSARSTSHSQATRTKPVGHTARDWSSTATAATVTTSSSAKVRNDRRVGSVGKGRGGLDVDSLTRSFSSLSVSTRPRQGGFHKQSASPHQGQRQIRRFSLGPNSNVEDICKALGRQQFRHVVCMVGAGISTSSGIPDFRTPGSGLYDNLQKYDIPYPEAIFDLDFFRRQPKPFLCLAKELYPGNFKPNVVHNFLNLLSEKGVLQRIYTQNIDGLERLAGVPAEKIVEAHGTFSSASCVSCKRVEDVDKVKEKIFSGVVPRCSHCKGLVKPDIVFFGENLPGRFFSLQWSDLRVCDLLVVMGTSLEVEPFNGLVDMVRSTSPRLLINRDLVGPFSEKRKRLARAAPDLAIKGDLVAGVKRLSALAGWSNDLDVAERTFSENWKSKHREERQASTAKASPKKAPPAAVFSSVGQTSQWSDFRTGRREGSVASSDADSDSASESSTDTPSPSTSSGSESGSNLN